MTFKSISHIERRAEATGNHFFSPDTMRFWHSVVDRSVYPVPYGALFVTSETDAHDADRRYTVRYAAELPGEKFTVDTVGEFRQWPTLILARGAAEKAAGEIRRTGEVPDTSGWPTD